jgi:hypothetical protein
MARLELCQQRDNAEAATTEIRCGRGNPARARFREKCPKIGQPEPAPLLSCCKVSPAAEGGLSFPAPASRFEGLALIHRRVTHLEDKLQPELQAAPSDPVGDDVAGKSITAVSIELSTT